MSFHDVLPADVKMALACQPRSERAPQVESEPSTSSAPTSMSEPPVESVPKHESEPRIERAPNMESEPIHAREPDLGSEPLGARAPEEMSEPVQTSVPSPLSAKRREPKWRAKSKVLAGREPGKPASWGFVCGSCKYPVDAHLRGEHAPGCKNSMHNASLLEGAEEFAHLVK